MGSESRKQDNGGGDWLLMGRDATFHGDGCRQAYDVDQMQGRIM